MSSTHTPGPWHVEDDGFGHLSVRSGNARDIGGGTVLYVASEVGGLRRGPNFKDRSEQQANARLIAAAPNLLSSLSQKVHDAEQACFEEWLEINSPSGDHEEVQRKWRQSSDYKDFFVEWAEQHDAIAEATGEGA